MKNMINALMIAIFAISQVNAIKVSTLAEKAFTIERPGLGEG